MHDKYVYELTEEAGITLSAYEYDRLNAQIADLRFMVQDAKACWILATTIEGVDYWCGIYLLRIGNLAKLIRERDWWWERSKSYGALPF